MKIPRVFSSRTLHPRAASPEEVSLRDTHSLLQDPGKEANSDVIRRLDGILKDINSDVIQKLYDFGVRIAILSERMPSDTPSAEGSYGLNTHRVEFTNAEVLDSDEQRLRHKVFHELLGHALLAQRNFGNRNKIIEQLHLVLQFGFGSTLKREVKEVSRLYEKFQFKGRALQVAQVLKLVASAKDLPEGPLASQVASEVFNQAFGVEADIKITPLKNPDDSITKSTIIADGLNFTEIQGFEVTNTPGLSQFTFKGKVTNRYVSWAAEPSGGGLLKFLGGMLAAFSVNPPIGLCLCVAPVTKFMRERFIHKVADVKLKDGATIPVQWKGTTFRVSVPQDSLTELIDEPNLWDYYAFRCNDREEYLAQGIATFYNSTESRSRLQALDPELHDFIEQKFGNLLKNGDTSH